METTQLRSYLMRNSDGMTELDISGQELGTVPPEVYHCSKIQALKVSRNKLREIPKTISSLRQLRVLDVSTNFLTAIPETIVNCTYLTELNVENNRLAVLPVNLGLLSHLKVLKLGQNQLESLTNEIGFLESLVCLDLHGNRLWYLPFSLGNLHKLRHLNLSDNLFEHLPMPVCRIRSLVVLNLSGNQLISLAPDFDNLRNLKELNLSSNQLRVVPPAVCQTKNLRFLNLAANRLKALPAQLSKLSKLQVLHSQQNYIESIPEDLNSLSYLNVAQNNLHNFSVGGMKKLKYLNASKNLLENTPMALFNLTKLEHLKLNANRLTFLSQDIVLLKNLKTLDLGNNRLTNLPQVINELQHLDFFNIKGNSINQRLHPSIGEEGQRVEERLAVNSASEEKVKKKGFFAGYSTLAPRKDHHQQRSGGYNFGQSRTLGPRTGMWTQEELLQDGFSRQILSDSQSCVVSGKNANAEAAEVSFPDHSYVTNRRENYEWNDEEGHSRRKYDVKGDNSIRHNDRGDKSVRRSTHYTGRSADYREPGVLESSQTNLNRVTSPSTESLSSTDFKLLGVCSQLEAMLNEELLHPVLTHPGSLSKSFKKKSIIKAPNGLWRLKQKDPEKNVDETELSPLPTRAPRTSNNTLRLRSATPSRRRLFQASSRPSSLSPPLQRRSGGTTYYRRHFSSPPRRPAINVDTWEPDAPQVTEAIGHGQNQASNGRCYSPPPRPQSRANSHIGLYPSSSTPALVTRSNIDRFMLSHQGRTCVSSVDSKVTVIVPKNGAPRPAYIMMQLERIPGNTLETGRKDQDLIANIISLSPILHLTTSQPIDCHGKVTMTVPMPPGGKKGKLHLLTVRGDNSCIPCTAGYHIKNGYLTLQTGQLSGKVIVFTKSKCKYKACKSVEQLLQSHYV